MKLKSNLLRYITLIIELAVRDVKMRYKLSVLGIYWAVINPLLIALIYGFVFSEIFHAKGISGVPYVAFIFTGVTFWNLFANSLTSAVNSLTGNAVMLSKVSFPRVILPTSSVVARLVDFLFSLVVLIGIMIYYKLHFSLNMVAIVLLLIAELIIALGLSYVFSALNVLYRDVAQILNIVLMLWVYLSPVFYTMQQIPAKYHSIYKYNPVGQLISQEVTLMLRGKLPDVYSIIYYMSISIVVLIVGYVIFKIIEPIFSEVM